VSSEIEEGGSHLLATLQISLDPALLDLALTHRSYSYEHGGIPTNERLEFLGDSILGQAVTVMLYTTFTTLDEGELAKRRASLVSTVALAEIARGIGLGEYIKLGRGEELTGGRDKASILADTVEAIIGATYLDQGPDVATALVLRLVAPPGQRPVAVRRVDGPEDVAAGACQPARARRAGLHDRGERTRPSEDVRGHGHDRLVDAGRAARARERERVEQEAGGVDGRGRRVRAAGLRLEPCPNSPRSRWCAPDSSPPCQEQ